MACKLKVLEPLRILSDGGSWSLYELYAALVTGPRGGIRANLASKLIYPTTTPTTTAQQVGTGIPSPSLPAENENVGLSI